MQLEGTENITGFYINHQLCRAIP